MHAVLACAAFVFGARDGLAYCRTTTCGSALSADCAVETRKCPESGVPLFWQEQAVDIGVENGSSVRAISASTARDVLELSLLAWTAVDCGGHGPSIDVMSVGVFPDPGPLGRDGFHTSSNSLHFFDESWPHDPSAIALTTVRYGLTTGRISAADIEVNSADYDLTLDDVGGNFDLQSVLTHESGHFFGLAHVVDPQATMAPVYSGHGNVDRRTLEENDREGICAIYPPDRFAEPSGGCACSMGHRDARSWAGAAGVAAMYALGRRRRRRAGASA